MLTKEQAAPDCADATDGCRRSELSTRDNAHKLQRVKPDPDTSAVADLDCEHERSGMTRSSQLLHTADVP